MQVRVTSSSVALDMPDDCSTLTLRVAPDAAPALPSVLSRSSAGGVHGDDVLLSVSWLRSQASGRIGVGWNYRFAHMLLQAAAGNQLTDDGVNLRLPIAPAGT